MTNSLTPRGADILIAALHDLGVEKIFTLSGNHIMPIFDAVIGSGIELIHTRHEAACVHMADAYARVSGKVGVALVTGGPGHANAVSALYTAAMAESAVVLLSGHAPMGQLGMGAFQEMAQVDIAAPLCKAAWLARSPAELASDVVRAFSLASKGRPGPVHVSLPSDVLERRLGEMPVLSALPAEANDAGSDEFRVMLDWLAEGAHPLVLAGPALLTRTNRLRLDTLESNLGIPVIGMQSPRGVADPALGALAEVLAKADRVLLLGKRLDFTLKFGQAPLRADCTFAMLDADQAEIERAQRALGIRLVHALVASPSDVVNQHRNATRSPNTQHIEWRAFVDSCITFRPEAWAVIKATPFTERLHPVAALAPWQAILNSHPDSVLVSDGGEIGQWAQAVLTAPHRIFNGVAGSIGSAISFALGARAALGQGAPIVAVMGDGTFGFHCAEFDTAARHKLPFIAVVGNDERWNAEYQIQVREYGEPRAHSCELLPTRYERVAAAFGAHGALVTTSDDLSAAIQSSSNAVANGQAACVNVMIEGLSAPNFKR